MLQELYEKFDSRLAEANLELRADGMREIPRFHVKVLGQTAIIEAKLGLNVTATLDVDAYANFIWLARQIFEKVLADQGLVYDELSSEIWMPEDTVYKLLHKGDNFDGYVAKPEYVLLSKLIKAPEKNKVLILNYLAMGPSEIFLSLCAKYQVDLKEFIRNV